MHHCFLCHQPTQRLMSLTLLETPPATARDTVPICTSCAPDWNFALMVNLSADLTYVAKTPPPSNLSFTRPTTLPSDGPP